jgi:fructose-bisphosphate aldolase, class II
MASIKPGVVTGKAYQAVIAAAKQGGYALPAVNVVGTNSANAVLEAAAKAGSDVIIQLSNGGAAFYAGQGYPDSHEAMVLGAVSCARHIHLLAARYGVCVALHTDHANKKLIPWVNDLIGHSELEYERTGMPLFSSHMLDLSELSLQENIDLSATALARMAAIDMSLEIELGVTGGEEDGIGHELEEGADSSHLYTQPADVLAAYNALNPIGHFSIAASFGNVHGVYKPGNVQLRPEILRDSQALVRETHNTAANPLHLVFHGGSGSEPAKIAEAVSYGVFKMNIDTDTQFAFAQPIGDYVKASPRAFSHQIDPEDGKPTKKTYDPRKWLRKGEQGIVDRLQQAFEELGSTGRSAAR